MPGWQVSAVYCSLRSVSSCRLCSIATSRAKQHNKSSCQLITTVNGGKSQAIQVWWCSDSLCSTIGQILRNSSCGERLQFFKNLRNSFIRNIKISTIQCTTRRKTLWISNSINSSYLLALIRDKVTIWIQKNVEKSWTFFMLKYIYKIFVFF